MTEALVEQLAVPPPLQWWKATVISVEGSTLTVDYRGGSVAGCAYLTTYMPTVGDTVHVLALEGMGALVLGATLGTLVAHAAPEPPDPVKVMPLWDGPHEVSPDVAGVWTYRPEELATLPLPAGVLEVLVTRATGSGPPLLCLVDEAGRPITDPMPTVMPPHQTPTWLPVPTSWARQLVERRAAGIGVTTLRGYAHGVFTGGTIRCTPIR